MQALEQQRSWSIYVLRDPATLEIRYVGVTVERLEKRLWDHCHAGRRRERNHRNCWIKSILDRGERPIIEAVETGTGDGWAEAEKAWIAHLRATGIRLTNATDGGEGTRGFHRTFSAETLARMSAMRKGLPRPGNPANWIPGPETRAKLSAARRGIRRKPETIRKMRESFMRAGGNRGERGWKAKLTSEQVMEIRQRRADGETSSSLAREFGMRQCSVSQICNGITWKHLPLIPKNN